MVACVGNLRVLPVILTCVAGTKPKDNPLRCKWLDFKYRLNGMEEVVGSIPIRSTKFSITYELPDRSFGSKFQKAVQI